MAAPTVTAELTTVTTAETATNWTGGSQEDVAIQGTYSVGYRVSKSTRHIYYDYSGTGSFDFSVGGANENEHVYVWANCLAAASLNTIANGGLAVRVGDGTNYGLWYVGGYEAGGVGNQNYGGGWKCFVVSPNRQFDSVSGSWTTSGNPAQLSAVDEFGMYFDVDLAASGTNCFVDAIRVGKGLRIENGDAGDPATWDALFAADDLNANKYGIVRKVSNTFFVQGKIFIGHDTGTSTTYFNDSDKVVIFEENIHPTDSSLFVDPDFYEIKAENNTTIIMGDVVGSEQDSRGISGITLRGQPTIKPKIDFKDADLDVLKLYAMQAANIADVLIGDDGYTMDGYCELVDCTFNTTDRIAFNLGTTYDHLFLRNTTVSSAEVDEAAIQLFEPDVLDGGEFTSLLSDGYAFSSEDDSAVETIELSNHDLTTNAGYIRVYEDKTWDVINPIWNPSLTTQEDLKFESSTGQVNEKFSLDLSTTQPDGTAISGATTYVYEGLTNQDLPSDNQQTTDGSGEASSNILKREFTWDGGQALDVASYGDFALRVYKYGRTPFVGALTVTAGINQGVTLVSDPSVTEASAATAISNGSGITVTFHRTGETDPRPMKALNYDGGTGLFVAGETVTGAGGGSGTVLEVLGDATSGTLVVEVWNGTEFINDEALTGSASGASVAHLSGGGSFYKEYTVEVDANSKAMTIVYDYLAARMAEDPITAAYEEVIIWGEDEQSQLVYSGGSGYFTGRNVANTEGVWVANRGTGTVAYFTADDGTQYIPAVQYTFSLTGLKSNSEVRIYKTSDDTELGGTESSSTSFSYNYIYSGDIGIYVVVFHLNWVPIRLVGLTLSNSSQAIPVQQQTDRVYNNP